MERIYLVRYGLERAIGRFAAGAEALARGQAVVIRSSRGLELGEVVAETTAAAPEGAVKAAPRVVRAATADDIERAGRAGTLRDERFASIRRVFDDGVWPLEPVDLEPLLDGVAVLHYLGPHRLELDGIRQALRDRCGFEVVFQPAGRDEPEPEPADEPEPGDGASHGCGAEGCGGGGGCATTAGETGGCSSCAVKSLIAARRGPRG